jgi:prepilin-type N-terminal cleavage/methylation domain-containing protein
VRARLRVVRKRLRLTDESGFTLSEMLVVLVILGVIVGALTQLFVSAMRTEVDQTKRFQAQQQGRLALDGLRREIHCGNSVTGTFPGSSVTITLGSYCPSHTGAVTTDESVTWCTLSVSGSSRYALYRANPGQACSAVNCTSNCVKKADYLTTASVFTNLAAAGGGSRAKLSIDLPVDLDPAKVGGVYELKDDIVLRNTARS